MPATFVDADRKVRHTFASAPRTLRLGIVVTLGIRTAEFDLAAGEHHREPILAGKGQRCFSGGPKWLLSSWIPKNRAKAT